MVRPSWAGAFAAAGLVVLVIGCGSGSTPTTTPSSKPPQTPLVDDTAGKGAPTPVAVDFEKDVKPTLLEHCLPCHAGPSPKGGIDMTALTATDGTKFGKMAQMVGSGKMPPPQGKPLDDADRAKLVENLKSLAG